MPLYDYECLNCEHVFELRQSFDSLPESSCPECGGTARRKFHPVPIIYKGSGFYTTDYKRSGSAPRDNTSSSTTASDDKKESSTKSETSSKPPKKEKKSSD